MNVHSSVVATDRDDIVGRLVDGRYRINSVLARGGMSTVYLATDIRLDRVVAVKVMHRSLAEDPGFVARFEHEAKAAAKLNHPNVVGVFDQGSYDGLVFLVMEYVPGHTLRDVIVTYGALEPARALGVVDQVLMALAAAHDAGFVHRDIKPENVLITAEGVVKVADFGLARAMTGESSGATSQGLIIGTVAYLSPEQVETGAADERSDIYATGVMLFELLTGKVPFEAPTPLAVAFRHVNEEVPAPSSVQAGVPDYVDDLVLTATAKDPVDRYSDAWTFAQALDTAQDRLARDEAAEPSNDDALRHPQHEPESESESEDQAVGGIAAAATAAATAGAASRAFGPVAPSVAAAVTPAASEIDTATAGTSHSTTARSGAGTTTEVVPTSAAESPTAVFTNTTAEATTTAFRRGGSDGTQVLTRPATGEDAGPIVIPDARNPSSRHSGAEHATTGGWGDDEPPVAGPRDRPGIKPARRGGRLILVSILAVLAVLVGGGAWSLGSARYVDTPDVTGQSVAEASRNLAVLELALVEAGQEPSDTVAAGLVLRTDPSAGTRARPGSSVDAYVSSGPQLFTVPDVTGQSIDSATAEMKTANLVVANVEQVNDAGVPQGMVVGSQPASGSQHPAGTEVTLRVSRGSEPIAIPDVSGLTTAAARTKITRAGLVPTVREEYASTDIPTGQVISTDPGSGTEVQPGDTVTVVVSKGREPATVPDVVGMGQQEAVAALQAAGLTPATNNQLPIVVLDRVYAQNPPAGTTLPRGSTVTLTIV